MLFPTAPRETGTLNLWATLQVIFHVSVRNIRKRHGNAALGLCLTIFQAMLMVGVMYFMFDLFGMRRAAVRGDFLLFVMSGVFPFQTHASTIQAVASADGPTSAIMKHSPMNPIVAIAGAALSRLYLQTLTGIAILFIYHALWQPIEIEVPVGFLAMELLAWGSGIGIGMIFRAAKPWQPEFFGILTGLYARMNMIFSGKMAVANIMGSFMLSMFMWNPLFHIIDQSRGFIFLNYEPHVTSLMYPVVMTFVFIFIGLMLETFTNRHISSSWGARG